LTEKIEPKKRGRPPKNESSEINSVITNKSNTYEFNSYYHSFDSIFGSNFLSSYDIKQITAYVKNPMENIESIRELAWSVYNSSGIVTNTIDYMVSLPTLDKVVVKKSKTKKAEENKKKMIEVLNMIGHKEFMRDCLFSDAIEGMVIYYCETAEIPKNKFSKTMSDYDVQSVSEINESNEQNSLNMNISMVSLPLSHCKIVGLKNSSFVVAFDLKYFDNCEGESREKKLLKYPKEIRDGYANNQNNTSSNSWLILDNTRTVVHKIRSKRNEVYGRPLVLAALNNILYSDYFIETKRNVLSEINNRIYYQTFPEGKEKGTSSLSSKQQEDQHNAVKGAVLNRSNKSGTSFFSVAAGTKLDEIKVDTDIFDEKNEGNLTDSIATDLGFGASLLNASSSGNYSSQQNNLELIFAEVMTWIEGLQKELNKVLSAHVIKDENNKVEVYYLPVSLVNRDKTVKYMGDLYARGKGSLQAWVATTGWDVEAYISLMDEELEKDFENIYPTHKTSFTLKSEEDANPSDWDQSGGRPTKDSNNDNTLKNKTSGGNNRPKSGH
jgi:hypothetical protein